MVYEIWVNNYKLDEGLNYYTAKYIVTELQKSFKELNFEIRPVFFH